MKKLILFLCLLMVIVLPACSVAKSDTDVKEPVAKDTSQGIYQKIDQKTAYESMQEDKKIILLDVRTEEEFSEIHIPGAILIPVDELKVKAESILTDKEAQIYVYCRSGKRSKVASDTLISMGYKNVFDMGGINDWTYETVTGK